MDKKQKRILLVEPDYENKYPPLGLMKIATAHKLREDYVYHQRGDNAILRDQQWDVVYISTLFTYQWQRTIDTIRFYANGRNRVVVGGIMASLMPKEILELTGIKPQVGPFKGEANGFVDGAIKDPVLSKFIDYIKRWGIDFLPPDYGIFDGLSVPYQHMLDDYYICRTTKGCTRGCEFCAVSDLEPIFIDYLPLAPIVSYIQMLSGTKRNLLLLDDNVLLSPNFEKIVGEIRDLGFEKGARLKGKRRVVDFNQGLDIRLLEKSHLKSLSTIELRPLRLAFDDLDLEPIYTQKIEWALDAGFTDISSYVLYNYNDSPEDLYRRLEVSCKINAKHGCRIYSFPMKYIPCGSTNRKYISDKWTRRQIRSVQCILNATHGIGPTSSKFFKVAFGETVDEFMQILQMPENCIIQRSQYTNNGKIKSWKNSLDLMSPSENKLAKELIAGGAGTVNGYKGNQKVEEFLQFYKNEKIFDKASKL